MAMAIAPNSTFKPFTLRGNNFFATLCRIAVSGNYAIGGDALDFKALAKTSPKQPKFVLIFGIGGFVYSYDLVNKKVFVYVNTAGGVNTALGEHTAIAYVAGVTGDTIYALVVFG